MYNVYNLILYIVQNQRPKNIQLFPSTSWLCCHEGLEDGFEHQQHWLGIAFKPHIQRWIEGMEIGPWWVRAFISVRRGCFESAQGVQWYRRSSEKAEYERFEGWAVWGRVETRKDQGNCSQCSDMASFPEQWSCEVHLLCQGGACFMTSIGHLKTPIYL